LIKAKYKLEVRKPITSVSVRQSWPDLKSQRDIYVVVDGDYEVVVVVVAIVDLYLCCPTALRNSPQMWR